MSLWAPWQAWHVLLTHLAAMHGPTFACGRCWQLLAVLVLVQTAELQLPAVPVPALEQTAELQVSAVLVLGQAAELHSLPESLQACTAQCQISTTHSSSIVRGLIDHDYEIYLCTSAEIS